MDVRDTHSKNGVVQSTHGGKSFGEIMERQQPILNTQVIHQHFIIIAFAGKYYA
jgi:hypothetical protein